VAVRAQKVEAADPPVQTRGKEQPAEEQQGLGRVVKDLAGLGDTLGPIGLTYSGDVKVRAQLKCDLPMQMVLHAN
jgi:hypothetical protein